MNFFRMCLVLCLIFISGLLPAKTFKVGETILVAFPANNIKNDAYIIGIVRKITAKGGYQIAVTDFVEGHDYGLSCEPIAIDTDGSISSQSGWEIWQDTTNLINKQLEFIVPADKAMKLSSGQLMFIDRYNIYIIYSRWKSNAPIISIGKIESAKHAAIAVGIGAINPAFNLAILDRISYYDIQTGRPFWPFQSIKPLTEMLTSIQSILDKDKNLNSLWRAKKRNWEEIEKDMRIYFLIDAIDKAVTDASYILHEDDLDKADPKYLAKLKQQLNQLGF